MTITAQTSLSGPYAGNGVTDTFAYAFKVLDEDHLVVTLADSSNVETVQTITTHYTVTGVGASGGGNVVMVTPPASGESLTITRSVPKTQVTDLLNRRSLAPEVIEAALDKLTQIAQDYDRDFSRTILSAVTSGITGLTLPDAVAARIIGWNATADGLINYTVNGSGYLSLPGSSTDNAVPRFDGTTGVIFQNSGVLVDDSNNITGVNDLTADAWKLDDTNGGRLGIGTTSPETEIHLSSTDPKIRFYDEDNAAGTGVDLRHAGRFFIIDIDPSMVAANSSFQLDIDNVKAMEVGGTGGGAVFGNGDPDRALRLVGTDALKIPVGTTGQRPGTPEVGDLRWNSTLSVVEFYNGSTWLTISAGGFVDAGEVATTTGTTVTLASSIPAGVSHITVALANVSTNGTSPITLEVGHSAGTWMTSGYLSGSSNDATQRNDTTAYSLVNTTAATDTASGVVTLVKVTDATDLWAISGTIYNTTGANVFFNAGNVALGGELDAIRLNTVGGTATFDGGGAKVQYVVT